METPEGDTVSEEQLSIQDLLDMVLESLREKLYTEDGKALDGTQMTIALISVVENVLERVGVKMDAADLLSMMRMAFTVSHLMEEAQKSCAAEQPLMPDSGSLSSQSAAPPVTIPAAYSAPPWPYAGKTSYAGYASYADYLRSPHWQDVRAKALKRAEEACSICHDRTAVQVHHNNYDRLGRELDSDVVVLCRKCHGIYHASEKKA